MSGEDSHNPHPGVDMPQDYELHRNNMQQRQRAAVARASEIGPLPEVVDPERRVAAQFDLRAFCETYRPQAFTMSWSDDHLQAIQRIEATVLNGGLFALAMPRGSGKTTLTVTAAIWALLYGHRRWVCLIGATNPKAAALLKSINTELRFNERLLEDFPEACYPIRRLEGKAARANGQTLNGEHTSISLKVDMIGLPVVPGASCSGGMVTVCGITGDIRGQQLTLPSGEVMRPDYVILDDPQTRESASSITQTDSRLATINGDVLGLAGPGVKIAGIIPCTVIQRGDLADQLLNNETHAEWHGRRTQLLYGMPTNMALWEQYQEIRELDFRNGGCGAAATQFYLQNQAEMDVGCIAAWPDRFNEDEITAIQHAMNLFGRDEGAFYAEYQNEPLEAQEGEILSVDAISQRTNPYARSVVPSEAEVLTCMVDVQKDCLFYVVTAWKRDFTGWIVDYGTWPDQQTTNFRYNQIKQTFGRMWPRESLEVHLKKGLTSLTDELLAKQWLRDDGAEMGIQRLLIDANWGQSRDLVYRFCRESRHKSVVMPCHGKYVGASSEPLNARHVSKSRGKTVGQHWRIAKAKDSPVRHVLFDSNFWKSFFHSRLATEPSTSGSVTLYQGSPRIHHTIANHFRAEYAVRTEGRGREVDEWKLRADRPDNHWFDCAIGCCVAASVLGCKLFADRPLKMGTKSASADPSQPPAPKTKRQRSVSYL